MPVATFVIKGTRYYDAHHEARRGALRQHAEVLLRPEDDNPHDRNAIRVELAATGSMLGHVLRDLAPRYRQLLAAKAIRHARVHSVGWVDTQDGAQRLRVAVRLAIADSAPHQSRAGTMRESVGIPRLPGVYALVNDQQGRTYIGSSKDMRSRVARHFDQLRRGTHENSLLQLHFRQQSGGGIRPTVLRRVGALSSLAQAEASAISAALRANQRLYNLTLDGQGRAARFHDSDDAVPVSERTDDWSSARQNSPTRRQDRNATTTDHPIHGEVRSASDPMQLSSGQRARSATALILLVAALIAVLAVWSRLKR